MAIHSPKYAIEDLTERENNNIIELQEEEECLKREEKWLQLNCVISLRSSQDQVLWAMFGAFWASSALLLVAIFPEGKPPQASVGIFIAIVGVAISAVWFLLLIRLQCYMERYETIIRKLQEQLKIHSSLELRLSQARPENIYMRLSNIPARKLMKTCSLVSAFSWNFAFIYFSFLFTTNLFRTI